MKTRIFTPEGRLQVAEEGLCQVKDIPPTWWQEVTGITPPREWAGYFLVDPAEVDPLAWDWLQTYKAGLLFYDCLKGGWLAPFRVEALSEKYAFHQGVPLTAVAYVLARAAVRLGGQHLLLEALTHEMRLLPMEPGIWPAAEQCSLERLTYSEWLEGVGDPEGAALVRVKGKGLGPDISAPF
jgi:hypothetical protein